MIRVSIILAVAFALLWNPQAFSYQRITARDLAEEFNRISEPDASYMSGRMYLAIRAVEEFRKKQKDLRPSERHIQNFDVRVVRSSPWLQKEEEGSHFKVALYPRLGDDDEPALDQTQTSLGRQVFYAVRVSDNKVVRWQFSGARSVTVPPDGRDRGRNTH